MNQPAKPSDAVFPQTAKEKQRVETIKEIGTILKQIYKNLWVSYEVKAAIKTEYYEDETVPIRDLLTPDRSPLYKTQRFISSGAKAGAFKRAFVEQLLKGNYPNLIKEMGAPPASFASRTTTEGWPSVDSTQEIWTDEWGYSIYFPYSEDYPLVNPLDVNNNTVDGQLITIVYADREADSGPGDEPYQCRIDPHQPWGLDNITICYRTVTVDDNYADGGGPHPVNIVGIGAEPAIVNIVDQTNQVYLVFLGDVKCNHQYDKFISASGNGGGSELRFIRGSAYLQQNTNGQITNPQDLITVNIRRKSIRYGGRWQRVYSIWDPNWETDDLQQVFAIYEEDNQGTKTITGQLTTTLTLATGVTQVGNFGYNFTITSNDDIIRQINWDWASFYQYNQGGLNNGCGTRDGWTEYDCNSTVHYNMPQQ